MNGSTPGQNYRDEAPAGVDNRRDPRSRSGTPLIRAKRKEVYYDNRGDGN